MGWILNPPNKNTTGTVEGSVGKGWSPGKEVEVDNKGQTGNNQK